MHFCTNPLVFHRYFRHASGEMYAISQALAKFLSINRWVLFIILISGSTHKTNDARINLSLTDFADLFSGPTPMMMWARDLGLLGLMSNMLMNRSFAAHLGPQVRSLLSPSLHLLIARLFFRICLLPRDNRRYVFVSRSYMCWCLIWFSSGLVWRKSKPDADSDFWRYNSSFNISFIFCTWLCKES